MNPGAEISDEISEKPRNQPEQHLHAQFQRRNTGSFGIFFFFAGFIFLWILPETVPAVHADHGILNLQPGTAFGQVPKPEDGKSVSGLFSGGPGRVIS